MRITNPLGESGGFVRAALKVVLVRPTLWVAFAGDVEDALIAIRHVADAQLDVLETESYLREAHERSRSIRATDEAEFVVASLRPSRLTVIKRGRADVSGNGWLGDHAAFEEYQRHYNADRVVLAYAMFEGLPDAAERAGDVEIAPRMSDGMHAVVDGPWQEIDDRGRRVRVLPRPRGGSHPTVGEAIVEAVPRNPDNLFGYSTYVRAEAPPFTEPLPARHGVSPADFGSAERGSFSLSMLVPAERGVGAVGLYFSEGRLGALYAPLTLDEPELYRDVTRSSFVEQVHLHRDITLEGLGSD
jgi:hypothetical protein